MTEHFDIEDPQGGITHYVCFTIDGRKWGFMLPSITQYQKVDATDFAPKVQAGDRTYADLSIWSVWSQDDWRHGFGFMKWSDERGYHSSGDGIDTRFSDIAIMATQLVSSETEKAMTKFVDFNGDVYGLYSSNNGVRKYTVASSTWADTTETTGAMLDGLSLGDYLVVCPNGARMRKMNAAGTWSDVGATGNPPTDMAHICLHGGYFWASEDGASYLHYASELDLSDLEGGNTTDLGVIVVGPGDIPIVNMISFANNLYVAREDGLWIIGDDNIAYQVADFSRERHAQNFEAMAVYQGRLYFGVRQRLYAYTGSTMIDVTPSRFSDVFPYSEYGRFKFIVPRGKFLYVIAGSNESTAHDALLCFDGTGWHKLWDVTAGSYVVQAMDLSTTTDRIWINHTGTAQATKYYQMQTLSELPYNNYATTGNHYLYTSKFDAGFADITKCFRSVAIVSENLSSTEKIEVSYQLDDSGTWTTLGSFTSSPEESVDFASGVTGKRIQFRLNFSTGSASECPVLDAFVVYFIMRPETVWAWQMTLSLADNQETLDRTTEKNLSAKEKLKALEAARASTSPILFEDPYGESRYVYVTSVREVGHSMKEARETEDIEWNVQVAVINA